MEHQFYKLAYLSKATVLEELRSRTEIKLETSNTISGVVEDSFANETLKSNSVLIKTDDEQSRRLFELDNIIPWLHFNAKDGDAVDAKRLNGWRLLHKGEIEIRQEQYLCLGPLDKGCLRLWFIEIRSVKTVELVLWEVLRSYEKEAEPMVSLLRNELGLEEAQLDGSLIAYALGLANLPTTKAGLGKEEKTKTVLERSFSTYLQDAFSMVPGICADVDVECLHQYRVELRKVRSLMGIFKKSFTLWSKTVKDSLRVLMQKTNQLRDLDVFIDSKQGFLKLVDEDQKVHLAQIFDHVKKEREGELKLVSKFVLSEEFHRLTGTCTKFFEPRSPIWSVDSKNRSVQEDYQNRLIKLFEEIRQATFELHEDSQATQIHQLRISHKKLRYLLDFIADFEPSGELEEVRKRLKTSQKTLGQYNDLCVQSVWISYWQIKSKALLSEPQVLSIEKLKSIFVAKEEELRREALLHAHESISIETEALVRKISGRGGKK